MSQPVVHFEIIGADPARLRGYYGKLFGWEYGLGDAQTEAVSAPGQYGFIDGKTTGQNGINGGVGGGSGRVPQVLFYVAVPSVAAALADAERLRGEALAAKAAAEQTLAQATAEAEGILGNAREEVSRMQARAAQGLQNAIALREQQALDRIAQSEAAASKQVRDMAVDTALAATRSLLREQVGSGKSNDVDQAIAELPRRLH